MALCKTYLATVLLTVFLVTLYISRLFVFQTLTKNSSSNWRFMREAIRLRGLVPVHHDDLLRSTIPSVGNALGHLSIRGKPHFQHDRLTCFVEPSEATEINGKGVRFQLWVQFGTGLP
jgi:hypothetical protein